MDEIAIFVAASLPLRSESSRRRRAQASSTAQANKITVWLQVDAQSGWPDVVAAANAQFQQDHPGVTVDVQYQNWGDHLQKFDATLAGGNTPDVIEMGNTEMTKYMAAGAFADSRRQVVVRELRELARRASRSRATTAARRYGVPYYAGSRVVTYRTDLFKKAGIKKLPTSLAQFTADAQEARGEEQERQGLLAGLRRRAPTGTSR